MPTVSPNKRKSGKKAMKKLPSAESNPKPAAPPSEPVLDPIANRRRSDRSNKGQIRVGAQWVPTDLLEIGEDDHVDLDGDDD